MPHMQNIETAVGEDERFASRAPFRNALDKLLSGEQFLVRSAHKPFLGIGCPNPALAILPEGEQHGQQVGIVHTAIAVRICLQRTAALPERKQHG